MHRLLLYLTLLRQQGGQLTGLWSELGLVGQTTHLDQTWQLQTSEFVRGTFLSGVKRVPNPVCQSYKYVYECITIVLLQVTINVLCSGTQFPQTGDVVPVGCTVCILEGDIITLNCTRQSVSEVFYVWRNGTGIAVSILPLLTTGTNDEYNCTATNLDRTNTAIFVSMVACK